MAAAAGKPLQNNDKFCGDPPRAAAPSA